MARAFSSGAVGDTVEVDLSRAFFGNDYPFVMLAELQSAGVEFRFAAGSGNLDRFGASRCVDPGRLPRLFLIAGKDPPLEPGSVVLASVVGIGDDELDEYTDLQAAFGDHLRAGEVTVDADAVRGTFGPATSQLDDVAAVLATPGRPAAGLARSLEAWQRWGYVHIPTALRRVVPALVRPRAPLVVRLPDRGAGPAGHRPERTRTRPPAADIVPVVVSQHVRRFRCPGSPRGSANDAPTAR